MTALIFLFQLVLLVTLISVLREQVHTRRVLKEVRAALGRLPQIPAAPSHETTLRIGEWQSRPMNEQDWERVHRRAGAAQPDG